MMYTFRLLHLTQILPYPSEGRIKLANPEPNLSRPHGTDTVDGEVHGVLEDLERIPVGPVLQPLSRPSTVHLPRPFLPLQSVL